MLIGQESNQESRSIQLGTIRARIKIRRVQPLCDLKITQHESDEISGIRMVALD